jgi:hypothetical protein
MHDLLSAAAFGFIVLYLFAAWGTAIYLVLLLLHWLF